MGRFIWSALVLLVLIAAQSATAYNPDRETCENSADDQDWNEAEKFVWRCACAGKAANFNAQSWVDSDQDNCQIRESRPALFYLRPNSECRDKGRRMPGESRCWQGKSRKIRSRFLETILYHKPFQDEVKRFGVSIEGAHFTETMNLNHGHILWPLKLLHSRFEGSFHMSRTKTDHYVGLSGSYFLGQINLGESYFGHYLYMYHTTSEHLNLGGIHVEKHLDLDGSRVLDLGGEAPKSNKKNLTIVLAFVGTNLHMQGVEADRAYLRWLRVGDLLTMRGTAISDKLNLESAVVGGNLHMHRVKVGNADLNNIRVGGLLGMEDALIFKELDMESAAIGGHLLMKCMAAFGKVNVTSATIASNLDLSHVIFRPFPTSKASIKEVLSEEQRAPCPVNREELDAAIKLYTQHSNQRNPSPPSVNLRHTKVGTLISTPDSWPGKANDLHLGGFIYDQHIAPADDETADVRQWSVRDYADWLNKDPAISLQPYEQLASVLRTTGRISEADDVLYEGRERERENAKGWRKLRLGMWSMVGYGIGLHTLWAASGLFLLSCFGWFFLWITDERWEHKNEINGPIGFWFSVDYVLPAVRLRSAHYEKVELPSRSRICFRKLHIPWSCPFPLRGYFYLHQIMGYALMFFIIAGLSGVIR